MRNAVPRSVSRDVSCGRRKWGGTSVTTRIGLRRVIAGLLFWLPILVGPIQGTIGGETSRTVATVSVASNTGTPGLAGRLGGDRQSFEHLYGASTDAALSQLYQVDGFGLVSVQFRPTKTPSPGDPAVRIVLRSARSSEIAATEPDAQDWSVPEAREAARQFLPADAVLETEGQLADGVATFDCTSPSLENDFANRSVPAGCRVSMIMPTATSVSFVTLHLGGGKGSDTSSRPSDRCAGMVRWTENTGQRIQSSAEMLRKVGTLVETSIGSAEQLRLFSTQFISLMAEQERDPVPPGATKTNQLLTSAFKAYAGALDLAAQGIDIGDMRLVVRATSAIDAATVSYREALDMIDPVLIDCGLVATATPDATAEP